MAVLSGQCLDRRIADAAALTTEVDTSRTRRNTHNAKASWHYTTADACVKLKSLYPALWKFQSSCPSLAERAASALRHPLTNPSPCPAEFGLMPRDCRIRAAISPHSILTKL